MTVNIGIDVGGTKIEIIVLHHEECLLRYRIATPHDYQSILQAIVKLVEDARQLVALPTTIGIGMPGAFTSAGLVKNSNTVCLNGKPFQYDLESLLQQKIRVMNDANCFALSEAIDGAAKDTKVMLGIILGTGVGGGVVINQQPLIGTNFIAGEWGHNPLPATAPRTSTQSRACYCGKFDCIETYLNGAGLTKTYEEITRLTKSSLDIHQRIIEAQPHALQAYECYQLQLAASLATVINIIDPNVIVLGGGLSALPELANTIQVLLSQFVFSSELTTQIRTPCYGDSSGVRGAAWLWRH